MNIYFYHEGTDTSLPELMVASARQSNPHLPVVQISDSKTPKVSGVSVHLKFDVSVRGVMFRRALCYSYALRTLGGLGIFVDTDMLFLRQIDFNQILLNSEGVIILCRRSYDNQSIFNHKHYPGLEDYAGKTLGECFPFLGSFITTGSQLALNRIAEKMAALSDEKQNWYGDQIALADLANDLDISVIEVPESRYGYVPQLRENFDTSKLATDIKLVHFKGDRKKLMRRCYELLFKQSLNCPNESGHLGPVL